MHNRLRAGILGALLVAPVTAAVPASAIPLQQPEVTEQAAPVGTVCIQQFPQSIFCSLSAGTGSFKGY